MKIREFTLIHIIGERISLPALRITDNTLPAAAIDSSEICIVLSRRNRFQTEYLNSRTGRSPEKQAGRNNLRVIKDHYRIRRQFLGNISENAIPDIAVLINQEFR